MTVLRCDGWTFAPRDGCRPTGIEPTRHVGFRPRAPDARGHHEGARADAGGIRSGDDPEGRPSRRNDARRRSAQVRPPARRRPDTGRRGVVRKPNWGSPTSGCCSPRGSVPPDRLLGGPGADALMGFRPLQGFPPRCRGDAFTSPPLAGLQRPWSEDRGRRYPSGCYRAPR